MARTKKLYYKVDCEECRELGLTGIDKDVYYFIKAFNGGLTMGQSVMAYYLCTTGRSVQSAIKRLQHQGLIQKSDSEFDVNGGKLYCYTVVPPSEKISEGVRKNFPRGTEKISEGVRKNFPRGTEKISEGSIYINNKVLTSNRQPIVTNNIQGRVVAPPENNDSNNDSKNDTSDTLRVTLPDLVLAVWCERYREDIGTTYVPDHRTLTSDRTVIADAVEKKMAEFAKDASDIEEARQFLGDMIRAMRAASDPWQRDHWTLHTVATQFNELYNRIKNGNKSNNNPKSRISDDYILRTMREAGIDV